MNLDCWEGLKPNVPLYETLQLLFHMEKALTRVVKEEQKKKPNNNELNVTKNKLIIKKSNQILL